MNKNIVVIAIAKTPDNFGGVSVTVHFELRENVQVQGGGILHGSADEGQHEKLYNYMNRRLAEIALQSGAAWTGRVLV